MARIRLRWRNYLTPKRGNSAAECEDAIEGDVVDKRFAIADGASESYAAGEFARMLAREYVSNGADREWLIQPRVQWQERFGKGEVAWYAEEKIASGAHATFLGLNVGTEGEHGRWSAVAAGDSCLFVLHEGKLATSFPLDQSSAFNGAPALVRSHGEEPMWEFGMGELHGGDRLLLATDALAQYLLCTSEAGNFAGPALLSIQDADDFAKWVQDARAAGQLKNDDVALGIIEFGE